MTRHVWYIPSVSLLLVGCSPAAGNASDAVDSTQSANNKRAVADACDILTVDFVEKSLGTSGLPIDDASRTSNKAASFTSCTLKWNSSKTREMVVGGRSITVPDENRVTLSVSVFEPGRSQLAYNAGVRRLKERNESTEISGVGEEATWIPNLSQISVRGRSNVFHLTVHYPDGTGAPREYARRMASQVLGMIE